MMKSEIERIKSSHLTFDHKFVYSLKLSAFGSMVVPSLTLLLNCVNGV